MKAKDLPIYDDPFHGKEVCHVPHPSTQFTETVTTVRKTATGAIETTMVYVDLVKEKYNIGKAHTLSALEVLQNDPGSLPRAGVITVAGLGGIVAGYRRGFFRRGIYSGLAMAVAASICYPNQVVDIANTGYARARDEAMKLWYGEEAEKKEPFTERIVEVSSQKPLPNDMGQSKPEDKDMYTTRS